MKEPSRAEAADDPTRNTGDVVSWDLIQNNTIDSMTLMPGSDPLFGLNTLGGAVSIQTKDGVGSPGLAGQLTYGSSGRKALEAEYGGGKATGFNWYLAANAFHESGWRVDSPSDVSYFADSANNRRARLLTRSITLGSSFSFVKIP